MLCVKACFNSPGRKEPDIFYVDYFALVWGDKECLIYGTEGIVSHGPYLFWFCLCISMHFVSEEARDFEKFLEPLESRKGKVGTNHLLRPRNLLTPRASAL